MNRRSFTAFEFAYWLQGAIEIGLIDTFNERQVLAIKRRINDVETRDRLVFTVWLLLNMAPPAAAFKAVRDQLACTFVHDIDPTYNGDQEHFKLIHDGAAE
jgi:hypothetical protein